jgi:hypothetical protein
MANTTPDTETTIEVLLEQRTQYEEWLARLDASGDKVPPAVRQRVRGDYEARLRAVLDQLRGRGAAISEELERHHAAQAELDRERRTAEEALAEAEIRHAVGEYGEDEWHRLSEQSRGEIDQLRARLRTVGGDIARLTEVQTLVAAPRTAAPPSAPAPKPEIVEETPFVTHVAEPIVEAKPAPPPPERPAARPPRPQPEPAAAAPSDELAFLKSVSDDEHRPAQRRPSNEGGTGSAVTTAAPRAPEPAAQTTTSVSGKSPSGVAKTLKCGECGTLNRPTEWYCERCGAELAGV